MDMKSVDERRKALADVPENYRELVELYVRLAFDARSRERVVRQGCLL